ncbi:MULTISPECIES: type I-F CRISPR-associated helicase Cas3f [unclassified Arsenophonus]|uniref:type I-F CRISPR-associated helicase Cas3f n=1 Tax=unclassified Arsenophonus TaxID=2627083 RepID=UPI0028614694|nr:type I-F CRISPR-associated helicase Cas3f [Arsenophonus sp.]MDR5610470.1 type I-F CRISPR-associated helicase Cas3f [Arsenophonus sp.]MDR5614303.1 type I-F CRISPR-associated helicase Cas3f [Arsenophonus sp.]
MMVTFVSQCEKNALKRTRRILDAFANRIGDNTWQTLITEKGLKTVHKMLRQSASRNSAISCHWIRSRSRIQLLWVVGNKNKFNSEGHVPVNRTEKSLFGSQYENNWRYLPLIDAFTRLAGLLHDWGKTTRLFQTKLDPQCKTSAKGDPIRHEWISVLLFSALVKSGDQPQHDPGWLDTLITQRMDEAKLQNWIAEQNGHLQQIKPLTHLPDAASLLSWLIVSHHRLPSLHVQKEINNLKDHTSDTITLLLQRLKQDWGYENRQDEKQYQQRVSQCFEFPQGLLSQSSVWLTALSSAANHLKQHLHLFMEAMQNGSWRLIAHHARLCLMLGDHHYSSQNNDPNWQTNINLYANTVREPNGTRLKQKLDEHLLNVTEAARNVVEYLPFFESEPPVACDIKELKPKKNTKQEFQWQDKAVTAISHYRDQNNDNISGFFIVNMASTGCGKTLANAKIMQALSDDKQSLRYILALGLRTLTLQTGHEYRDRIGLDDSQLAVLIGSQAIQQLHQDEQSPKNEQQETNYEATGSASEENLFDGDDELHWQKQAWQGVLPEEELTTVLRRAKDRALLYAPVLACTIDHIMTATETTRGGRYILPCLRLMSSDLVIDEVDDFMGEDLVAIGRLIHLAGMLGRKVMISSATIPPDLALSFFHAYQQGWQLHATSRQLNHQVGCVWVDEFTTHLATLNHNEQTAQYYQAEHQAFIQKRTEQLAKKPAKRKATILPLSRDKNDTKQQIRYFQAIQQAIIAQHQQHSFPDQLTGINVSFGVVRMANIQPCIRLTRFLLEATWPEEIDIRAMAYHSQQVLLLRHAQEKHLDAVLKRKEEPGETPAALNDPVIRNHLNQTKTKQLIFILVATPVEEVGRDHDFDWAVIEPSSYRSLIQLAGRVRRHRQTAVEQPNMTLLQYNWKGYQGKNERVFWQPGYETAAKYTLATHDLTQLVDESQLRDTVDATLRIQKPTELQPKNKLADLEHHVIGQTLGCQYLVPQNKNVAAQKTATGKTPDQLWGYTSGCWWMTGLPQHINRFRRNTLSTQLYLMKVKENQRPIFQRYDKQNGWKRVEQLFGIKPQPVAEHFLQKLWLVRDYVMLINQRQQENEQMLYDSYIFGEITFTQWDKTRTYYYNDQWGLEEKEEEMDD